MRGVGFIYGGKQTKFGELYEDNLDDLMKQAVTGALEEAELSVKDVDLIVVSSMTSSELSGQGHLSGYATSVLGSSCPVVSVDAACGGGGSAMYVAVKMMAGGGFNNVLVIGAEKMTDFSASEVATVMMRAASYESEAVHGLTFPGINGLVASAYLNKFGVGRETLGRVSVVNHDHGADNPLAHLPRRITLKEYLQAEMVAEPLGLLDCAPISDGAAAVVVGKKPRSGKSVVGAVVQEQDLISLYERESLTSFAAVKKAARNLKEVEVYELHDAFSITELVSIESLGLARAGGGGKWLEKNRQRVNLTGGLKAGGHPAAATGLRQIIDVDRAIKNGARSGVAQSLGGIAGTCVLTRLEKDDEH